VAEDRRGTERPESESPPSAPELLRAALEKVVFFEWRLGEVAAELAAAQSRAAAVDAERARALEERAAAQREAQVARLRAQDLEAERARFSSLLARPAQALADAAALQAERARTAQLQSELSEARREVELQRAERDRWLEEMLARARGGGDAEGSLAAFISELRGEVIALRERVTQSDELLRQHGLEPLQAASAALPPDPAPHDATQEARVLWEQGRLGTIVEPVAVARAPSMAAAPGTPPSAGAAFGSRPGTAATALLEQCLRGLASRDAARREQAARHLAAVPAAAAAPALASAAGTEPEPRVRAQIARALAACGGPGAADVVAQLQADPEPLVRLAALDALCTVEDRAPDALETAAQDAVPAVRRRAAALAAAAGADEVRSRLAADADASVRAAATPREPVRASAEAAVPPARDLGREALLAVQAAIFGLTEPDLARALAVPEDDAAALAVRLVAAGQLTRRGRRLVAASAPGAAAQGGT
jgi:HEAT repeat protein